MCTPEVCARRRGRQPTERCTLGVNDGYPRCTRKNVSFSLDGHYRAFIDEEVASGRYSSAIDVVRSALRLLKAREARIERIAPRPRCWRTKWRSDRLRLRRVLRLPWLATPAPPPVGTTGHRRHRRTPNRRPDLLRDRSTRSRKRQCVARRPVGPLAPKVTDFICGLPRCSLFGIIIIDDNHKQCQPHPHGHDPSTHARAEIGHEHQPRITRSALPTSNPRAHSHARHRVAPTGADHCSAGHRLPQRTCSVAGGI
jgi:putative addiction module CopG family antidote